MKGKTIFGGEWVKVTNMKNKRFNAGKPCSKCTTFKVKPVWYSIKTGEVRCTDCFTPDGY